jgi:hypothetical protein
MKLGTNRVSARSMVIWVTVGFVALLPVLWRMTTLTGLSVTVVLIGLTSGLVNGLGMETSDIRDIRVAFRRSAAAPMGAGA